MITQIATESFYVSLAVAAIATHLLIAQKSKLLKTVPPMNITETERKDPWFKRTLALGELLTWFFAFAGLVIGVYIKFQMRLHDQENEQKNLEEKVQQIRSDLKEIKDLQKESQREIMNIRIDMGEKADRRPTRQ